MSRNPLPPDTGPPAPKEKRGLGTALNTAELQLVYRLLSLLQAAVLEETSRAYAVGWWASGNVLLQEFCRTGRVKFLLAFVTHLLAILGREPEASP